MSSTTDVGTTTPQVNPFVVAVLQPANGGYRLMRFVSHHLDGLDGTSCWLTAEQIVQLDLALPCNAWCDGDGDDVDPCPDLALPGSNWCNRHS